MPQPALQLLQEAMPGMKKVRYYEETDGDHFSYEAKLRYQGQFLSIEFTKEGVLEDVEVRVNYKDLPSLLRREIESYLQKECETFKVIKTQKQYRHTGAEPLVTITDAIEKKDNNEIFYELEIDLRTGSGWSSHEFLFNQSGELISKRRIITRPLDNLLY